MMHGVVLYLDEVGDKMGLHGKDDVVLLGETAQVEDRIAHPSQGCVDAHAGGVGYLLEAHVPVVTHDKHLALAVGQGLDETPDVVMDLGSDHFILDGAGSKFLAVEDIHLVIIG